MLAELEAPSAGVIKKLNADGTGIWYPHVANALIAEAMACRDCTRLAAEWGIDWVLAGIQELSVSFVEFGPECEFCAWRGANQAAHSSLMRKTDVE